MRMGKTPYIEAVAARLMLPAMKGNRRKKGLTLGELIACVYRIRGQRRAPGMVQLATRANLIGFRGPHYFTAP